LVIIAGFGEKVKVVMKWEKGRKGWDGKKDKRDGKMKWEKGRKGWNGRMG
jgi:hypothetical protein